MARFVRTVLGDVEPASLGVTDAHDHLFLEGPGLPGTPLVDVGEAEAEVLAWRAAGGSALVEWTPAGLGRRPEALVDIARRTGVHVVAATGIHRSPLYQTPKGTRWPADLDEEALAELFVDELTLGIHADGGGGRSIARAGLIKIATGYRRIDDDEHGVLRAAAIAHAETGAPICVHLDLGTGGPAVLDELVKLGVEPHHVVLGHLARNPDADLSLELAERGAYLAYDGPNRLTHATDWKLGELVAAIVAAGHGSNLLLGVDTVNAETRTAPGTAALLADTARGLRRRLGDAVLDAILIDNPARAFAWAS